jgi:hypothetical protein
MLFFYIFAMHNDGKSPPRLRHFTTAVLLNYDRGGGVSPLGSSFYTTAVAFYGTWEMCFL